MSSCKTLLGCVVVILCLMAPAARAQEQSDKAAEQQGAEARVKLPHCPLDDGPVNFVVSVMTDDGPVYFCCTDCQKKFEADPKKLAEKAASQREALAKLPRVQVKCPITGKPISKEHVAEVGGQKVYFCCPACPAKYEENPAKYKAALLASYTYQTRCPVMGGRIDPAVWADLPDGNRVYFCCRACDDQLRKDPGRYADKLKEQGIHLDVKKITAATPSPAEEGKSRKPEQQQHQGHKH